MTHLKTLLSLLTLSLTVSCTATLDDFGGDAGGGPMKEPDVRLGDPDVQMRGKLIHKIGFGIDPSIDAQGGTAQLTFFNPEALPPDDRIRVEMNDGEFCTFEAGTEYPETSGLWPSTKFSAGDATLNVAAGPRPIVLEEFDRFYFPDEPVKVGAGTHKSFFDGSFLAAGSNYTMSFAGTDDVGAFSFDSSIPQDFDVISPDIADEDVLVDVAKEFSLRWSPGQSDTTMVALLRTGGLYIKCDLKDDGEGTISAEAMNLLTGSAITPLHIKFWREKRIKTQVRDDANRIVEIEMTNRTNKYGTFAHSENSSSN